MQIDVDAMTPDEAKAHQARIERLDNFSETIKKLRTSAIEARNQSGIESQWQEDEDFYESIDDANRTTTSRVKPYDFGGTGTGPTKLPEPAPTRSSMFVPMTRPYVDLAAALIADLYLPTDDRNWDGEPTPVPDLIKQINDTTPLAPPPVAPPVASAAPPPMGQPPQPPPVPAASPVAPQPQQPPATPGADSQPPGPPQTVGDLAQQEIDKANEAWKKARDRIDDWLIGCAYNAEMRKVIKDMARIGVGIMKGPFPKNKSSKAVMKTSSGYAIEIEDKVIPASKRIDPWRFYPDGACGEDINSGSHTFEEDFLTRSKLRDLRKIEGYIESQIDKCLEEGPKSAIAGSKHKDKSNESELFQVWYFEGQVEWQDLQDAGCDVDGEAGDVFHAVVTMVNDHVIKAALSHLDSEEFTYDVVVWQRKSGLWIGDGVARQGRTAQRGLNAAVRALMDNAGQSARPIKVINRTVLTAGPDPWTYYTKGDADVADVAHAITFFSVPSVQQELQAIIQYFSKMYEDATGLPMMLQGQQGTASETVGGMELLMNNANIVPRDIVRRLDDCITEPHINRYYEYLLIHGEDDSEKGEFDIHARGSSALMERAAQDQFLLSIASFATNPEFELDPELYMEELLKSKRINPDRLKLSDEKKKARASQPPPEDPRITAAKIMAQSKTDSINAQGQVDHSLQATKIQAEMQQTAQAMQHEQNLLQTGGATPHEANATARIETARIAAQSNQAIQASRAQAEQAYASTEAQMARDNAAARHQEIEDKRELAIITLMLQKGISTDQIKATMARTAIVEQTKRELAGASAALAQGENANDRTHDMIKHVAGMHNDAALAQAEQAAAQPPEMLQ